MTRLIPLAVLLLGLLFAGGAHAQQNISFRPIAPIPSASLEASHILKAAPGSLFSVYASNLTGGATGNLLVLNTTTVPVDGAVAPLACVPFNSNGLALVSFYGGPPASFTSGIVVVISSATSCLTKTTGVLTGFIAGVVQ